MSSWCADLGRHLAYGASGVTGGPSHMPGPTGGRASPSPRWARRGASAATAEPPLQRCSGYRFRPHRPLQAHLQVSTTSDLVSATACYRRTVPKSTCQGTDSGSVELAHDKEKTLAGPNRGLCKDYRTRFWRGRRSPDQLRQGAATRLRRAPSAVKFGSWDYRPQVTVAPFILQ